MRNLLIGLLVSYCTYVKAGEFDSTSIPEKQLNCLALNVYHEARDQELVGQVATAFVVMNRVQSRRFPDTICGVIHHGYKPMRNDCHFSWFCDGKPDTPYNTKAWEEAVHVANWVAYQHENIVDPTMGATHYHATSVTPWWASKLDFLTDIGDHKFYLEGDHWYAQR